MKVRSLPALLILPTVWAFVLSAPALSQQPAAASPSVAEAARAAQAQKANSGRPPKVITNDDLAPQSAPTAAAAAPQAAPEAAPPVSQTNSAEAAPTPAGAPAKPSGAAPQQAAVANEPGGCHNPESDEAIQAEIQAAQDELDQLRHDLAENPMAIPNQNIDMSNFKPGGSGVDLGSPPLSDAQPQSPGRIKEVELEQRIASLKRAAVVTCDSAKNGEIQRKIDEAQQQLTLAQRELDLDSSTYYSNPNYAQDTAGKAKIDGQQEQVQSLQSEIDSLKQELAASKSN
jgi:hypothetical protein